MSWTQPRPDTSLTLINDLQLDKNAPIIDVGGGESRLVDYLLQEGFTDITVLDISQTAIDRAKARLGPLSDRVTWIVSNVLEFIPERPYTLWHDRATFHFLTEKQDIEKYVGIVEKCVIEGEVILGTFSTAGPARCSGLPVKQYDFDSIQEVFGQSFRLTRSLRVDHITPFNTTQNFIFSNFRKVIQ
ncbi:class I SAM-dependent methyltransferase [Dyadobacter sp. BHUBP1]|uniref:class I SAM-dependent methyltransferase n=1 Tax=Dyadobacter sp. BHUBP1 TaxID=3424178 RepID=UPI003D354845